MVDLSCSCARGCYCSSSYILLSKQRSCLSTPCYGCFVSSLTTALSFRASPCARCPLCPPERHVSLLLTLAQNSGGSAGLHFTVPPNPFAHDCSTPLVCPERRGPLAFPTFVHLTGRCAVSSPSPCFSSLPLGSLRGIESGKCTTEPHGVCPCALSSPHPSGSAEVQSPRV